MLMLRLLRLSFDNFAGVDDDVDAFNARPAYYWDKFYINNKANFFKDRNWLRLEFSELMDCAKQDVSWVELTFDGLIWCEETEWDWNGTRDNLLVFSELTGSGRGEKRARCS